MVAENKRICKGLALLIGADTNCHSTIYGKETNKRGEELEDFIAASNLNVENTGTFPTFNTQWGKSVIDVTLTRRLAVSVKNWNVNLDYKRVGP